MHRRTSIEMHRGIFCGRLFFCQIAPLCLLSSTGVQYISFAPNLSCAPEFQHPNNWTHTHRHLHHHPHTHHQYHQHLEHLGCTISSIPASGANPPRAALSWRPLINQLSDFGTLPPPPPAPINFTRIYQTLIKPRSLGGELCSGPTR